MSAVWRNVSRKSLHSSGMSPKRTSGRPAALLRAQPLGVDLNPRQRHARLHAPLHVDERDLHVDRGRKLGLGHADLTKLHDFAGLGTSGTRRTVGHVGIVAKELGGWRLEAGAGGLGVGLKKKAGERPQPLAPSPSP